MREELIKSLVSEARTDAKTSAFLAQELEAIEQELYRVEYPEMKFRRFIPVDGNYPAGVETISYRVFDVFGMATFISNYAQNLPSVAVRGEKFSSRVEGIGLSYGYSTQDLRAAAMAGMPLDREEGMAAMEFIERKMDDASAVGEASLGMLGLLNQPNVPIDAAPAGVSTHTDWARKTPDEILHDMHSLARAQWEDTKELHAPDTMLLPTEHYGLVATTKMGIDSNTTILQMFLSTNPWIRSVDSWHRLSTASETGSNRAMCYKKNPRVVKCAIPMEALQHEPERRGLYYHVPIEARFGGVLVRIPLALRYLDGI